MKTFADIIHCWPSTAEFARDVCVSPNMAYAWRRRGIPGNHFLAVVEAAQRRGFTNITHELLCRLAAGVEPVVDLGAGPPPEDAGDGVQAVKPGQKHQAEEIRAAVEGRHAPIPTPS